MIKITVLYGHPVDAAAFEAYYFSTHMPLVGKINGVVKAETTKFLTGFDGLKPPYYRLVDFYFNNLEELQAALRSPEGTATTEDLQNFASGGLTILMGEVD